MRIDVLGCRGSTPVDGVAFSRYGGATSSVLVGSGAGAAVLLDAGTGLRHLGQVVDAPFQGALFLSHLHWDHVQGLPFSPFLDHPDSRVDLYVPGQGPGAEALIRRLMAPPLFPIGPEGLRGRWNFHEVEPGTYTVGSLEVNAFEVPHKGGRTFGYRVEDETASMAYVSDHAPGRPGSGPGGLGDIDPAVVGAVEGVDLLFHDAQLLDGEYGERAFLGHSAIGYAVELGTKAGVGQIGLFHHDPLRTDADLDDIARGLPERARLVRQGMRW